MHTVTRRTLFSFGWRKRQIMSTVLVPRWENSIVIFVLGTIARIIFVLRFVFAPLYFFSLQFGFSIDAPPGKTNLGLEHCILVRTFSARMFADRCNVELFATSAVYRSRLFLSAGSFNWVSIPTIQLLFIVSPPVLAH